MEETVASEQDGRLLWTQPEWRATACEWLLAKLEQQGIRVTGSIEQPHTRPWSTVLCVPTENGPVYFKAVTPMYTHEPGLTEALGRWRPDCMPKTLALDRERRWMLLADAGVTLRSELKTNPDIRRWEQTLALYADVQIETISRQAELLALDVPDRRLAALPALYEELLADTSTLRVGQPGGLTADEYDRLRVFAPRFAELCARLTEYGLPETLHHDDLHDGNVFVHNGRLILSDWGDSGVAHPFFVLIVAIRSASRTLGLEPNSPEQARLRDAYLEPWAQYLGTRNNFPAICALAQTVGIVCRTLTWRDVVRSMDEASRAEHEAMVAGWLQVFLEAVANELEASS